MTELTYLKGIGEVRAKILATELRLHSVKDLLYYFPSRYVDKSRIYRISDLYETASQVQIKGQFVRFVKEGEGRKKRLIGLFTDGHHHMEVLWFSNIKYFEGAYKIGREYLLFGRPTLFNGTWSISHPEIDIYDPSKPPAGLVGVYPLTETLRKKGLSSRFFRNVAANALQHKVYLNIKETLPEEVIEAHKLMPLKDALRHLHNPTTQSELQKARERMKFEELYYLELNILRIARERNEKVEGYYFPKVGENFNRFYSEILPFELTEAQKRVMREIRADMATGKQMNRLIQGDVGSGKTVVAFLSLLLAADNGFQGALMAPTEILATQHFESLKIWCESLGLNIRLLTGSTSAKARKEIHSMLSEGQLDILVGTHALIEDTVKFKRLGLAVIDEQHRFGVAQRARLWKKGAVAPHVLVMTATPIPRTLAMTVYGDLDVSVIDQLPPGRKKIETRLYYEESRMSVYRLVMQQIQQGRQAYIVYPLIHENEKLDLKSLETGVERLRSIFHGVELCHVHGKMKPSEKEHQMQKFVSGKAKILVATTVIEVGVNVPNATVMVIENAERFGLSQLHQLRGRVGRGSELSFCILMSKQKGSADTRKRLGIMTETTDGFLIAEADMKLRGPGDMEGTQQSGIAFNLKIANLAQDGQLLGMARQTAIQTLDAFPELYKIDITSSSWQPPEDSRQDACSILMRELYTRFGKTYDWSQIS